MFFQDYICELCKCIVKDVTFKDRNSVSDTCKCLCGGVMTKLWSMPSVIFAEDNRAGVSSKPSSYWANAESIRKKRQKQKRAELKEKIRHGDDNTISKLTRKHDNYAARGCFDEANAIAETIEKRKV